MTAVPNAPRALTDAESPDGAILLVEDNEDNRVIYETYLTHAGFVVLAATDAETGLVQARTRCPALIVMDVGLPGLDGIEATRQLKADVATRGILVLVLTAHVDLEVRERALAAGCDHFLTKPLAPRALVSEIQRMLAAG